MFPGARLIIAPRVFASTDENSESQISNSKKGDSDDVVVSRDCLEFGIYLEFGIWILEFEFATLRRNA
jgi:hypothetical protein